MAGARLWACPHKHPARYTRIPDIFRSDIASFGVSVGIASIYDGTYFSIQVPRIHHCVGANNPLGMFIWVRIPSSIVQTNYIRFLSTLRSIGNPKSDQPWYFTSEKRQYYPRRRV